MSKMINFCFWKSFCNLKYDRFLAELFGKTRLLMHKEEMTYCRNTGTVNFEPVSVFFFQQTAVNLYIGKRFHHYLINGLLESRSHYTTLITSKHNKFSHFHDLDRTSILVELTRGTSTLQTRRRNKK